MYPLECLQDIRVDLQRGRLKGIESLDVVWCTKLLEVMLDGLTLLSVGTSDQRD